MVDCGPRFRANVYATRLSPGICANPLSYCRLIRIALAPVSPFVPLFLGFLQRYKPDAKLGTYYSLVLPYPLIFLVVWLLMLLAWYLVGLPIGPGIYHVFLRENGC
ncbi:AbgT family transporter [Escherichia coli]